MTTLERYPPGETVSQPLPGDFLLLCEGQDAWSRLIRVGQRLRFRGEEAHYARFNHAALFITSLGTTIEAFSSGVSYGHADAYQAKDYTVVRIEASAEDRAQVVAFAVSCLNEGYGWLTIASIVLSLLTGATFSVGFDGQEICSGLVARALERTSAIFPRDASHLTPADLARYYRVP